MPEQVKVEVDGKQFVGWNNLQIELAMDSYSVASFEAPFEADRFEFRETFRPYTFRRVDVRIGDELIFSGRMLGPTPRKTPDERSIVVDAYALPGVLQECTAPAAGVPLEFKKVGLRQIIDQVAAPFGLEVQFDDPPGPAFDKAAIEVDGKLHEFIVKLAQQRNLVISNTPQGSLLCWRSVATGNSVAQFSNELPPAGSVDGNYSVQEYWSEITGFASAKRGRTGDRHTENNPFLREVLRPLNFKVDDADKGDLPEATRAKLGRMLANIVSYDIGGIPTWRTQSGDLWKPNTTVILHSPDNMVYSPYEFLVRKVTFFQSQDQESAALNLVMPGTFSGQTPERLPWDEP